jgi:hypothetical protein
MAATLPGIAVLVLVLLVLAAAVGGTLHGAVAVGPEGGWAPLEGGAAPAAAGPLLLAAVRCGDDAVDAAWDLVRAYEALRRHGMLFPAHVTLVTETVCDGASASGSLVAHAFPRGVTARAALPAGVYRDVLVGLADDGTAAAADADADADGAGLEVALRALRHQLGVAVRAPPRPPARVVVVVGPAAEAWTAAAQGQLEADPAWTDWTAVPMNASSPVAAPVVLITLPLDADDVCALLTLAPGTVVMVVAAVDDASMETHMALEHLAHVLRVRLAWLPRTPPQTSLVPLLALLIDPMAAPAHGMLPPPPLPRLLMYAPWEQLGNQRLALLSACAVATLLDRVLVLPAVGFRSAAAPNAAPADAWGYVGYDPAAYAWLPIHRVWETAALPCRTVGLRTARTSGLLGTDGVVVRYHALGDGATTEAQVRSYYTNVARVRVARVEVDHPPGAYELSANTVQTLHGVQPERVLALGILFRFYDFGVGALPRPTLHFPDLVAASPLYAAMVRALVPTEDVRAVAAGLRLHVLGQARADTLACVHLRRGPDYRAKCKYWDAVTAGPLLHICLTPLDAVAAVVAAAVCNGSTAVYMSTDAAGDDAAAARTQLGTHVAAWSDDAVAYAHAHWPAEAARFTPVHWALLDQTLCASADHFWGNAVSSFSTAIKDARAVAGRPSAML